ncbi:MAG: hypothetical protein ABJ013_06205 [Halioglobus sp.]
MKLIMCRITFTPIEKLNRCMDIKDRLMRVIALQATLVISLCVTVWRVVDFTDELLNASFQMSMRQSRLTGDAALIIQVIIIAIFSACAYWAARQLLSKR